MESLSSWATLTSRFLFEAKKNHSRLSPKALNLFPSRDASHMRSVVRKHLQKGFTDGAILHLDSAFLKPHIRHLLNEGARVACENQVDVPDEVEMDTISSSLLRSVRKAIKSGAKRGTAAEWKHRQVGVYYLFALTFVTVCPCSRTPAIHRCSNACGPLEIPGDSAVEFHIVCACPGA